MTIFPWRAHLHVMHLIKFGQLMTGCEIAICWQMSAHTSGIMKYLHIGLNSSTCSSQPELGPCRCTLTGCNGELVEHMHRAYGGARIIIGKALPQGGCIAERIPQGCSPKSTTTCKRAPG